MTMAKAIPFLDIWTDAGGCTHFHGGGSSGKSRLGQVRWSFP
jgi:hypothetical protein